MDKMMRPDPEPVSRSLPASFVRNAMRASGATDDTIRQELVTRGFAQEQIDEVLP